MAIMTQQQPRLNPASGEQTSGDWWSTNAPAATTTQGAMLPTSATLPSASGFTAPGATADPTDAAGWMALVGNDQQLAAWIRSKKPGISEQDLGYYVKQVKGSPGANPAEQAGGAAYWAGRITEPAGGSQGGQGANQYGTGSFAGPPVVNMAQDPGYLERMKMGTDAIQGAAAAKGSLLGGGTLKALERYGQNYGSNEYGAMYDRARGAQGDYWQRLQGLYSGGQNASQGAYQKP